MTILVFQFSIVLITSNFSQIFLRSSGNEKSNILTFDLSSADSCHVSIESVSHTDDIKITHWGLMLFLSLTLHSCQLLQNLEITVYAADLQRSLQ